MFSKANQKFLNVSSGDTILISLNEDKSKYQAPMTEELEAVLLSDYDAYQIFEKLTPGRQRNIIFMVYRAKDSQKRVDIACAPEPGGTGDDPGPHRIGHRVAILR